MLAMLFKFNQTSRYKWRLRVGRGASKLLFKVKESS